MSPALIVVTRVIIALSLLGSVLVQVVILPLVWIDLEGEALWGRILLVAIAALSILCLQVGAIAVWRLLGLVRRGSVFSDAAFRWVDLIIGAIVMLSALVLVLAVALAPGEVAPGVVALLCGASLVIAGVALVVVVMRALLAQAIAREREARELRSELDEVI